MGGIVRILALETTEMIGSVAAMQDRNLLSERMLSTQQRSAQSLAPGLRSLLKQVRWRPADVELVAVSIGPGSFTGLRVGVATAKAFAYAAGAEILGVDTLQVIAAAAPDEIPALSAAVDAQRGQVVAQSFERDSDGWPQPSGAAELIDAYLWLQGLAAGAVVTGPVLGKLADRVPGHVTVLDAKYWPPKAASVARLAARDHAAGLRDDLWSLVPRYSRRSAAEEKWKKSGGQGLGD
ncbi:MAG: tRNA (adenosine(37)-N6)-threonylcarbamoyltransferase complex dimerization subunit type 1 TsaB [Planctomycetes bacterium RBG_13_63_9]|nr:MAG: tRNA (adenosine(37)-N6)-threonylcarbamoyltransferase complex dimerization subunit type 1 TsaB [Planctomycetes bacterium RBG_13_63_9]